MPVKIQNLSLLTAKKLKGTNTAITESLRATRMKKLNKGRGTYDFKKVWISDGKNLFKNGPGNTSLFYDSFIHQFY